MKCGTLKWNVDKVVYIIKNGVVSKKTEKNEGITDITAQNKKGLYTPKKVFSTS